jgi:DNA modification methylase
MEQAMKRQMNLFADVLHAYSAENGYAMDNATLYDMVAARAGIPAAAFDEKVPVGASGQPHNLLARRIRWHQQTLKHAGIIENAGRGIWQLTEPATKELNKIKPAMTVLGFSTDLGIAIIGTCETVFARIDEPIHLVVTSPPYPLAKARAYGNPSEPEYVDWICKTMEPVVKNLVPGGSICLNVSNDIFMPGLPSRSLYRERLIIALHDRLGLHKMDEIIWHNPSKAPAPVKWASMERVQLNVAWEPVYWLTNDPSRVRSDNRRVLLEHTERHLKLIQSGGEQRTASFADGAYNIHPGRFSNQTAGRIPRNVLTIGHQDKAQREYKDQAKAMGINAHGAPFPSRLAAFFIEFLTEPYELVADPFAGSFTLPAEAERLGRRWIGTEQILEYVAGAASRFTGAAGFQQHIGATA